MSHLNVVLRTEGSMQSVLMRRCSHQAREPLLRCGRREVMVVKPDFLLVLCSRKVAMSFLGACWSKAYYYSAPRLNAGVVLK